MAKRKTTEEFIADAKRVHGDRYDYSLVEYVNSNIKVVVVCKEHGNFLISPNKHIQNRGCKQCHIETTRKSNDYFIKKATEKHGDTYDYSMTQYTSSKDPVLVICKKHGEFSIRASKHLEGQGCYRCAKEHIANLQRKPKTKLLEEFRKVHGYKYDYSKVEYVDARTDILVICEKHGEFLINPSNHKKGNGCHKCGIESHKELLTKPFEYYVNLFKKIHNDKYEYIKPSYYTDSRDKIPIRCKKCNRYFEQTINAHRNSKGCPLCENIYGFDKSKKALLYYLKVTENDEAYYKIGITNKTSVAERFSSNDLAKIKVLNVVEYQNGQTCYDEEQRILKKFKNFRYKGSENILSSGGNTELFIKDVLGLDNGD